MRERGERLVERGLELLLSGERGRAREGEGQRWERRDREEEEEEEEEEEDAVLRRERLVGGKPSRGCSWDEDGRLQLNLIG